MNKVLTPVLALAAIGGAVFSISQWNARADADAANAEREAKLAELAQAAAEAMAQSAKAKADLETALADVARLKAERDAALEKSKQVAAAGGSPAVATGEPKPQFDLRAMMGNIAKGFDDPEQRKAMKSMQERMIGGAYEKLFAQLGLNDADTKLLTEILGERNFLAMRLSPKSGRKSRPQNLNTTARRGRFWASRNSAN
jgi:multidrug efflux pump subunit AcrA (membrane-fusion protein)